MEDWTDIREQVASGKVSKRANLRETGMHWKTLKKVLTHSYSAEGGETVRVMLGKYSKGESADLDLYLSGYSVEPWRSDRIGRGVCQITPCLSMLLLVQPTILRELMGNEEAFERGMTARLLTFTVETEPQEDDGSARRVSERAEAAWTGLIRGILDRRLHENRRGGEQHAI